MSFEMNSRLKLYICCSSFDTENNTWETIRSMNTVRYCAHATVLNGYIYIVGGLISAISLELYDPKIDEWTNLTSLNNHHVAFALIASNGFLFAMGSSDVIKKFDPYKNRWATVCELDDEPYKIKTNFINISFPFQVGSFDVSRQITSGVNINGKIFGIMSNGNFGRIEIDDNGKCLFVLLSKSEYGDELGGNYYLYNV